MGVENVVVTRVDGLEANFTGFYFLVRKIRFEDPKMYSFERVFRLYFLDFKFIVEFYQLNKIYVGFWHQILKINW